MFELDALTLIVSFVITWSIGLSPPLLIRYIILRRPIEKWPAIGICALFWVINIVIFIAMGSKSKTHGAALLIAFMSYWLLRQGTSKTQEQEQKIESKETEKPKPFAGFQDIPKQSSQGSADKKLISDGKG
ncbi:MAG: hypothetical protein WCO53_11310 [Deltaproteobacteria bacterium]